MTNKKLLEKLKEDMEMRGFSHYTKDSYYRKAKEIVKYFEYDSNTGILAYLKDGEYLIKIKTKIVSYDKVSWIVLEARGTVNIIEMGDSVDGTSSLNADNNSVKIYLKRMIK